MTDGFEFEEAFIWISAIIRFPELSERTLGRQRAAARAPETAVR